jgi:uncharacterized membrane protein HdeD (DUF308 family)
MDTTMNKLLSQAWWMLALRAVVALLFGILAFLLPGLTLLWLVTLFAVYALISGIASVVGAIQNRTSDRQWWLILLLGLVSIGAGIIAIVAPGLTALVWIYVIGANALITGVLDIAVAIRLRKVIEGEWLLIVAGLASVLFGISVILFPGAGALALVWLISAYALVTGILLLVLAFKARKWKRLLVPATA